MKAIGFNVAKGALHWAVVGGSLSDPRLLHRARAAHAEGWTGPERMVWLRDRFGEAIRAAGTDRVAYRAHVGRAMTQAQAAVFLHPWGVLHLVCADFGTVPLEVGSSALTAKRFGLPAGERPMLVCDTRLADPDGTPLRWDDQARYAACAAWAALA